MKGPFPNKDYMYNPLKSSVYQTNGKKRFCSKVFIFYTTKNYNDIFILILGGIEEFRTQCSDDHINTQESRPLYSPTTPIIEPQIETATASEILPFLYLGKSAYICPKIIIVKSTTVALTYKVEPVTQQ